MSAQPRSYILETKVPLSRSSRTTSIHGRISAKCSCRDMTTGCSVEFSIATDPSVATLRFLHVNHGVIVCLLGDMFTYEEFFNSGGSSYFNLCPG